MAQTLSMQGARPRPTTEFPDTREEIERLRRGLRRVLITPRGKVLPIRRVNLS